MVCVWIFLFITSYGYTLQMKAGYETKPLRFIVKRIILLYSEMWFFYLYNFIVIILFKPSALPYFLSSPINIPIDMLAVSNLFGKPLIVAEWYVNFLLIVIVVFPLLYFLVKKTTWFSLPIIILITMLCPYKMSFQYGGQFNYYLLMIVVGILFAQNSIFEKLARFKHQKEILVLISGLLLILNLLVVRYFLLCHDFEKEWYLSYGPVSTLMGIIIVIMVFLLRGEGKIQMLLQKLGKHSGNMFFTHIVFYNIFVRLLGIYNEIGSFFLCFAYSLSLSLFVEFVKKKTDYNNRIRNGLKRLLRENSIKKQDA
ncbi:Peptidoglycan/LPS O-acetylase OafA/YrhL, contains acyltransferase and SGNH-hydrolase domains [Ruminococcaceae bacterium KH2T8]|nr:Peptidoglycan/LPS O-acetylase OafA/YrhL, contains acyltransferase and SGNH-hydrolase domains [Ruminococcaceae bacterium KH2T8]